MDPITLPFAGCTIIAKHQLAKARALAQSWYRHVPSSDFFVLVIDPGQGFFRPERESFTVITPAELDIPNINDLLFRFGFPEVISILQPYFLLHLLRQEKFDRILYLSPDSWILQSLKPIFDAVGQSDIALLPTLTRPPVNENGLKDAALFPNELFRSDFLGLRNSPPVVIFLNWWRESQEGREFQTPDLQVVPGQWLIQVPALFDGVKILRRPEFRVGSWNLHELCDSQDSGQSARLEDRALIFDFEELDLLAPSDIPITDLSGAVVASFPDLLARYQRALIADDWEGSSAWTYGYDFYENGRKVLPGDRRRFRSENNGASVSSNPFAAHGRRAPGLLVPPSAYANRSAKPFGINVLGHLTSEKGVGEMGRSNLRILQAAGIPCVANDFVDHGAHNIEIRPDSYSISNPYPINLVSVNADCLGQYVSDNPSYLKEHFNIAYWAWELSEFPDEWAPSFGYVDEVWTLSDFARDSIAGSSPVPVHAVHCSLELDYEPEVEYRRPDFEIPDDLFVFLFFFDFHSYIERKNPIGLVQAFRKAFGLRTDVQLLIKSSHSRQHLDQLQLLKQAAAGANVRVLDEVLTRDAKQGLMMAADCYVSLHRSEGFGLTIAESMLCGKPTIATDYSGNRDFMSAETNYAIPYHLVTIDRDHGPYRKGQQWAQPDLDYAADVMRHVERNRGEAEALGQRAKSYISQVLHPATIGRKVRARLGELGFLDDPAPHD